MGSHLVLPVGLQQQRSRSHGGNLEDILTDQRNFLKQLLTSGAEDPNSIHFSNQDTLILDREPVIVGVKGQVDLNRKMFFTGLNEHSSP